MTPVKALAAAARLPLRCLCIRVWFAVHVHVDEAGGDQPPRPTRFSRAPCWHCRATSTISPSRIQIPPLDGSATAGSARTASTKTHSRGRIRCRCACVIASSRVQAVTAGRREEPPGGARLRLASRHRPCSRSPSRPATPFVTCSRSRRAAHRRPSGRSRRRVHRPGCMTKHSGLV